MTLEDRLDPPTFASMGADKCIKRKVERNGADACASLTNIGVDVFFGRPLGFIVRSFKSMLYELGMARVLSQQGRAPPQHH